MPSTATVGTPASRGTGASVAVSVKTAVIGHQGLERFGRRAASRRLPPAPTPGSPSRGSARRGLPRQGENPLGGRVSECQPVRVAALAEPVDLVVARAVVARAGRVLLL